MASLLFVRPYPISAVALSTGGGTGMANLLTPDPKEVFQDGGGGFNRVLDVDLGSVQSVDSIFLGFLGGPNLTNDVFVPAAFNGGAAAYTDATLNVAGIGNAPTDYATPKRRHYFHRIGAPVNLRYLRMTLFTPTANVHTLGIVAVGLAFQPFYGREWGSGRSIRDMSDVAELRAGGFAIERGARVPGFQFSLGDLTDAELVTAWEIVEEVGGSGPILVCEDPAISTGLNERLHWGLFDRPEAYERELPGRNRWSFRLKGWN